MTSKLCLMACLIGCAADATDPADVDPPETAIKPLTCDVITGPNCWKAALEEVSSCAPGHEIVGTLSSDGTRCSYPSGDEIAIDFSSTDDFSFEVTHDGALCAGFVKTEQGDDHRAVTTKSGTAAWTLGGGKLSLSCPDGAVYQSSLTALDCMGTFSGLGFITQIDDTSFVFSFMAKPENVDVASCAAPL